MEGRGASDRKVMASEDQAMGKRGLGENYAIAGDKQALTMKVNQNQR
jgi:hypothetical protein